jgi:hypothetical protein
MIDNVINHRIGNSGSPVHVSRALLTASASKVRALLVPASTLATDKKYTELEVVENEKSRDEMGRKFDCVEGALGN